MPSEATITTRCCIAGGGPAGMMLGLLLARSGVDVVVLEKHEDFLRDFRGDTIHPSTLELMHELGVLDRFLALPHQRAPQLVAEVGGLRTVFADFTHLPTRCRFLVFMPQWDFLNFLAEEASRYPSFRLRMRAEADELIEEDGRVVGVRATTPEGRLRVRADLVVGADGRDSFIRAAAGLPRRELGAPIDVLWFRLSRGEDHPAEPTGHFEAGHIVVMINRGEYWQLGYVIPKGSVDAIRARGLEAFRAEIVRLAPFLADRVRELRDWDDVRLLTVQVDRLRRWACPGLLCIGDAAHAMSPVGGVGVNLAVQDAVAAANLLAGGLRMGRLTDERVQRVQHRRELPTRIVQRAQVLIQDRVIRAVLEDEDGRLDPPPPVRLLLRFPLLRRLPGRAVGLGIRPEHVRIPEARPAAARPTSRPAS